MPIAMDAGCFQENFLMSVLAISITCMVDHSQRTCWACMWKLAMFNNNAQCLLQPLRMKSRSNQQRTTFQRFQLSVERINLFTLHHLLCTEPYCALIVQALAELNTRLLGKLEQQAVRLDEVERNLHQAELERMQRSQSWSLFGLSSKAA